MKLKNYKVAKLLNNFASIHLNNPKQIMAGRMTGENPLHISWVDSAWIPILNPNNVMDYFSGMIIWQLGDLKFKVMTNFLQKNQIPFTTGHATMKSSKCSAKVWNI